MRDDSAGRGSCGRDVEVERLRQRPAAVPPRQLYRIIAFMLVGVTLIGASYAYHRLEQRFLPSVKTTQPPTDT